MKHTLVVFYRHMKVGGIENYIIALMKASLAKGNRVVWLCDTDPHIAPIYDAFLSSGQVERYVCNTHHLHWFQHEKLEFTEEETVVVLSFSVYDFMRSFDLKKEFPNTTITPLYCIPHFTGAAIFPEASFQRLRKGVQKKFTKLYEEWVHAGMVLYFSPEHADAIEANYGITVPQAFRRVLPNIQIIPDFDEAAVKARYEREEFRIVSAGRLEFPHKGFVLGMIDEFAKLKQDYPFLTYHIIGEGPDEAAVHEKIKSLPPEIAEGIHLHGMMPFEDLLAFFTECNLNVSVAGCASYGAKVGLLTLPARHYSCDCEVYGFLPESKDCVLETKPGNPLRPYVEQVLDMSLEEYITCARKSYDSYERKEVDPGFFFQLGQIDQGYQIKYLSRLYGQVVSLTEKMLYIVQQIKKKFNR